MFKDKKNKLGKKRLDFILSERGLSKKDLCDEMEVSRTTVCDWYNFSISDKSLSKLCTVLEVTSDQILQPAKPIEFEIRYYSKGVGGTPLGNLKSCAYSGEIELFSVKYPQRLFVSAVAK